MRHKKGQIWISAVLYMALGVIVLTIVLAAGVPMIQKMKDKNSFAQAKTVFFTLNDNIKDVATEGPGSTRYIAPFEIKTGELAIDGAADTLTWSLRTKAKLMEPSYNFRDKPNEDLNCAGTTGVPCFQEGDLYLFAQDTNIVDEYVVNILLDYSELANVSVSSPFAGPFAGSYSLTIKHMGTYDAEGRPRVVLEIMP